jgi:3-oxoacyl-[acyl-carrier protein] reductase
MTSLLENRVVLITGAGQGIGRGIALACARAGARVVIAERDEGQGGDVAHEISERGGVAHFAPCDVTRRSEVDSAISDALEHFGQLDALVHNATSDRSPLPNAIEEVDASLLAEHTSVALRGTYSCARAGFEALREREGQLVILTSPAGIEGGSMLPLYSSVKAGQRAFVKSLSKEWGPHGVRVNAISPLASTPAMVRAFEADPALQAQLERLTPLGRIGDAELDVGTATTLLLSDQARYITGQTWVIDGGRFMGL